MKVLALAAACLMGATFTSFADADTLYIGGASGVHDAANASCSDPNIPTNEMWVTFGSHCFLSYPLNLPVGKTIDSITVEFNVETVQFGDATLVAYLAQNRTIPRLGPIAIAGNVANQNIAGPGVLTIPNLAIPVSGGSTYWVQLTDDNVSEVSSISITYH